MNPFEQFENIEPKQIEKSEIFNALRNPNSTLHVKKTGREIKNHIKDVVLPILLEKRDILTKQISNFLESVSVLPQQKPWMGRIMLMEEEFPYKQYTWDEQNWSEKSFGNIFKGFGDIDCCENCEEEIPHPYFPQSKEEAEARILYNRWVEDYRDLIYDIKTANVLISSLKDEDEYWLTIDQLTALNFDKS